jgi:dTDP-glucose 4,6-dehydratase
MSASIYNIGAGNERTNREITDTILAALGKDESSVDYVEDRKGHDRRYSIDTAKSQALGWSPSRTFEDAIDETIRWYVDHRDWWEPLRARVKNR